MIEKSCRCGKSKKNFSVNIGPFFIADCCTEAGYDHLGEKVEAPPAPEEKKKETKKEGPTRPYKPSGLFSKKNKNKKVEETPEVKTEEKTEDGQS